MTNIENPRLNTEDEQKSTPPLVVFSAFSEKALESQIEILKNFEPQTLDSGKYIITNNSDHIYYSLTRSLPSNPEILADEIKSEALRIGGWGNDEFANAARESGQWSTSIRAAMEHLEIDFADGNQTKVIPPVHIFLTHDYQLFKLTEPEEVRYCTNHRLTTLIKNVINPNELNIHAHKQISPNSIVRASNGLLRSTGESGDFRLFRPY